MSYKYLFGPVPSRRLGMTLGVDLVPHKVCNFNCVYCECGRTTEPAVERSEYVPIYKVLEELKDFFVNRPILDYITFSGSGEPLLNKGLGGVVTFVQQNFPGYKTALLTNSSLLTLPEVRAEVMPFDLIVPSLDAVSKAAFKKINRPCYDADPQAIVDALCKLRADFRGAFWLEIFIVPGLNDMPQELDLLSKAAERIKPDKVQINFLDRPGTEEWVRKPAKEELDRVLKFFKRVRVEVVPAVAQTRPTGAYGKDTVDAVLAMLKRRPCTAEDLAASLGMALPEVNALLDLLLEERKLAFKTEERGIFFRIA